MINLSVDRRRLAFSEIVALFESQRQMAAHFGISPAAITKWKRDGVPQHQVPYLMLKYPRLKAWDGLPRGV